MRDRVDQRDRHEALDELGHERPVGVDGPLGEPHRAEVGERDDEHAADQPGERERRREELRPARLIDDVRPLDPSAKVLPER